MAIRAPCLIDLQACCGPRGGDEKFLIVDRVQSAVARLSGRQLLMRVKCESQQPTRLGTELPASIANRANKRSRPTVTDEHRDILPGARRVGDGTRDDPELGIEGPQLLPVRRIVG